MKQHFFFWIILFAFVVSCSKEPNPKVSFYYWKTVCKLSDTEKNVLQDNAVEKLYVRYFDVALQNGNPFPVAPIHFEKKRIPAEIIPVVFIKNDVFLNTKFPVEDLAKQVLHLVNQIDLANELKTNELQIDCDWSLQSRDRFMAFMTSLQKQAHKIISVTIRLHQVKYFKETKIPPADYGVLMFYNMGKLEAHGTNSIYDKTIAQKYLAALKKYPLRLKIALPIFSWWVHERGNTIVQLIPKIKVEDFKNNPTFEIKEKETIVLKNCLLDGFFFKEGDRLRQEKISKEDLEEMTQLLKLSLPKKPEEVIFYDLDSKNLNNYNDKFFFKTLSAAIW